MLRARREKSRGNKDAEKLLRVRREKRVERTRMKSNCLKLEERRRVGGTRMQSNCLELEKEQR